MSNIQKNFQNGIFAFVFLFLIVDCRQSPYRYQFFASAPTTSSTTTTTTTTTTLPSTTSAAPSPTTTNTSLYQRFILNHKAGPYNTYLENGLEYVLPMLGRTKPTSTTPPSTTPLAINPLEVLRQRAVNRFCVDKSTCPYCPYEQGTTCCFKPINRGLNQRGECKCVTRVSDLNKCD